MLAAAVLCVACLASCGDSSSKSESSSSKASSSSSSSAESSSVAESSSAAESSSQAEESSTTDGSSLPESSSEAESSSEPDAKNEASITINVSEILENYDSLEKGLQSEEFVPQSGKIIDAKSYEFTEGQTVYDLLTKAAEENNIKIDSKTTEYGMYIEGINHIVAGSCGQASGWIYRVNGKDAELSADQIKLQKGDQVEFFYLCDYNKYYATQTTTETTTQAQTEADPQATTQAAA